MSKCACTIVEVSYLQKLSQLRLQIPFGLQYFSSIGLIDTIFLQTHNSVDAIRELQRDSIHHVDAHLRHISTEYIADPVNIETTFFLTLLQHTQESLWCHISISSHTATTSYYRTVLTSKMSSTFANITLTALSSSTEINLA